MWTKPRAHSTNRRRATIMTVGFVCTFFAGDFFLARMRLPPVSGSRNECRRKWERFARLPTVPDVVFLGCSFEWCGIRPDTVDEEVARLTGVPITSVNLSTAQASLVTQSLMVRRMVEADRLPKLVYLGVGPLAVDDLRHDWLATGLISLGDVRDLPLAASVGSRLFIDTLRYSLFASSHQWSDCRQIARRTVIGASLNLSLISARDERGWLALEEDLGGEPGILPYRLGPSEPVASAIHEQNANGRSLRRAIDQLRSKGVVVRLIEMPLASTASSEDDPNRNQAYKELLSAVVTDTAIVVVRPPRGLVSDDDFVDKGHLHRVGAEKFSRWLARDVARVVGAPASDTSTARHDAKNRAG